MQSPALHVFNFHVQVGDGTRIFANLGKVRKGAVIYRLVLQGHPTDMEWWEPRCNISEQALAEYEAAVAIEVAEAEREAEEDAELQTLEEELNGY